MTVQQEDRTTEVWESTIPGVTWVTVTDRRGAERSVKVSGGGRLRIRVVDREYTEDAILNEASNPFTNGTLRRIDNMPAEGLSAEEELASGFFTDAVMVHLLEKQDMEFLAAIDDMPERGVRMLKAYVVTHPAEANLDQSAVLDQVIKEKFTVEGVMPSTAEILIRDGEDV